MRVVADLLGELGDQLPLLPRDLLRNLDDDLHELIAFSVAAVDGNPLAAEPKDLPGLRPWRHLHDHLAVERRDIDACAQHGLRKRDRN